VILAGRDPHRLEEAAAAVGGIALRADLSSADGVQRLADAVRGTHPEVSLLFNNAAIQLNYHFAEVGPRRVLDDVASEVQTDLTAPIQLAALLLPSLREAAARTGAPSAIVNVTSGLALAPKGSGAVYSACKAGLRTFTLALRFQMEAALREGGPDVRVMDAMLPLVDTPMTAGRGREKISAADAAERIVRGVEGERNEIYVGKARLLRGLYRVAPSAAQRMFRNE
jgi:short-subunit dehydrogenase involved in D-alanine esterification of teichoic acids